MRATYTALILTSATALTACNTVPEPETGPIEIAAPEFDGCTPMSALTRVVIPEKTQKYFAITEIDNPPYEPIQSKEELTRIIEPERVIFVDSDGEEVTDVCETRINPDGMVREEDDEV